MSFTSSDSTLEIAPPSALELLWINHRTTLLGSIAAVLVLGAIAGAVLVSNHTSKLASETLLSNAKNDSGLQEVIAKYPHSPAAANAMLLLAASLRDEGKLKDSDELYSRFAESFPNSPLAVSGLLGRASNARVAGQIDTALNDYQQAAASYAQAYGAPFALFSEVQLLAQAGKSDEAKKVLQALASQYPGSAAGQAFGGSRTAAAEQ